MTLHLKTHITHLLLLYCLQKTFFLSLNKIHVKFTKRLHLIILTNYTRIINKALGPFSEYLIFPDSLLNSEVP